MKKYIFIIIFINLLFNVDAKIWRINNNSAINSDFPSFTAAQNAASSGDTLYFEGSTVSYGNITVTKPLVLIGPGYFLEENLETQAIKLPAKFGTITFSTGSSASRIVSLYISDKVTIYVNNVVITRCFANSIYLNSYYLSLSNILIISNYIYNRIYGSSENTITNILISNNYINDYYSTSISFNSNTEGIIINNILNDGASVYNFTFINNIIRSGSITKNNNTFINNICSGTQFPIGNGNQQNVNMDDVFVGATGNSTDGQWKLKQYSPAIAAGKDGTDCGIFGGATPYVLSGLPPIPAIYEITMPVSGDNLNGINVTIKAKTN